MAKAYINLEDAGDGQIACNVVFECEIANGFNQHSGAHRAAQHVLAEMDKIMTKAPESEEVVTVSAIVVP